MCGISGIIAAPGSRVVTSDIERLTDALAHRGPDGQGIHIADDGSAALGHRRLAIIDLAEYADQPLHSLNGRYSIVYNGEIYNFLELRETLVQRGCRFVTSSDTEVLIQAWAEWGWDMLPRLNGMWAFAIRDNQSGKLYLSRDRFGVKPLVYCQTPTAFAFASEAKALLQLKWIPRRIVAENLQRILFDPFTHEASADGIFDDLKKLPAGHCAEYHHGKLKVWRWWNSLDHLCEAPASLPRAAEQFRELFFDAVRLRMRSDVSIGTCLSGGFDSSAIVATMAAVSLSQGELTNRQAQNWKNSFVASFPGFGHDETEQAREAANYAHTNVNLLDFSKDDGEQLVDEVMNSLDDVYISLPTAIWKTYRAVSASKVRVTLDGHGADELFGGYRQQNRRSAYLIRNFLGANVGRGDFLRHTSDVIRRSWFTIQQTYFLSTPLLHSLPFFDSPALHDRLPANFSLLDRRLYGMFHVDILPTLLRNYDRLSMAHGVEVRMPFMDWRLATFVLSLPAKMKANALYSKLVAREAMRDRMPESIRSSPRKIGFNSQMPDWMNGTLGHWAENSLRQIHPALDAIVDTKALQLAVRKRNAAKSWDWSSSDRVWPYVNMNWYLHRHV
jgi:asparagine synthase (glutamine-hydrolysing)